MAYLYLLTESDTDTAFYHACINKLTGEEHEVLSSQQYRKGQNDSAVRRSIRFLLQDLAHSSGGLPDLRFVISVDNDRTAHPAHPGGRPHRKPGNRYNEIRQLIDMQWSSDWPVAGAIAVPVEMLESWLLLILGYSEPLPLLKKSSRPEAKRIHGKNVPAQLGDLCNRERLSLGIAGQMAFVRHCVEQMDPDDLAAKSPSFARFKQEVEAW
ncbi:MAG: hypothetical protein AAF730_16050 [Bacteroidota bacterium]